MQDFYDSSDEEQDQCYIQPNKQELLKFKIQQKHSNQEDPEYITEPLNRQNYEERKISKSKSSCGNQSLNSNSKSWFLLNLQNIESKENKNKIPQTKVPESVIDIFPEEKVVKISPTNKAEQNAGENDSIFHIEQPSLDSIPSDNMHKFSSLKNYEQSNKSLQQQNLNEFEANPIEFDSHPYKKFTEEKKVCNASDTIIDESLINPNIKNIRSKASHNFEEIDEWGKLQAFQQQNPKNKEVKKTMLSIEKSNTLNPRDLLKIKAEHHNTDQKGESEYDPEAEEQKYSTGQNVNKNASYKHSEVEDERRIEDPYSCGIRQLKSSTAYKENDEEVKSSKSIKAIKLQHSFDELLNQKLNNSFTPEFDEFGGYSYDILQKVNFLDREEYEFDITDLYKFKHQIAKDSPIVQNRKIQDSHENMQIKNKEEKVEKKEESNKLVESLRSYKESQQSDEDENIENDEEKHGTPSQSKMNKTKAINASVREEIKEMNKINENIQEQRDDGYLDWQKLNESKQSSEILKPYLEEEPLDKSQIDQILDSFNPEYESIQSRSKIQSKNQLKSDEDKEEFESIKNER